MATGKILIVDDEVDALDNCRRMLSRLGHDCLTENDPVRAVQRIQLERPELVFTDLRMPGLDGMGVLAEVKRVDPTIKVVLLTAYATVQTAVESMRQGALDYILKPYTSKDLEEVTRRAFGESGQAGERRPHSWAEPRDLGSERAHCEGRPDGRQHSDLRGEWNRQGIGGSGHP